MDVLVGERATVLELHAREDRRWSGGDALLFLDLFLHHVDRGLMTSGLIDSNSGLMVLPISFFRVQGS